MRGNIIRNQILQLAKPIIVKDGWNENLFNKIIKDSDVNINDLNALFPNGYRELLQYYLNEINKTMTKESKKIDFLRFKVHERIYKLCTLRLEILSKEKKLIVKTFYHLMLPQNYKFSLKNLYKTIDQIWFLGGDISTDFNFYSKRAILASIYTATIIHFINNDNFNETLIFLKKQLKKVSHIPKIKNRFADILKFSPNIIKFKKNFSFFKQ